MLLADFIREASSSLEALYPPQEARNIALLLCSERLGVESWTHIVEPSREVSSSDEPSLCSDLSRLLSGEPLQYVLGTATFFGREFRVTPAVLIPRPETEMLVSSLLDDLSRESAGPRAATGAEARAATGTGARAATGTGESAGATTFASLIPPTASCGPLPFTRPRAATGCCPGTLPLRILDLCTGSGCIAWTLAAELPGAEVIGVDISEDALAVAAGQKIDVAMGTGRPGSGVIAPKFIKADVLGEVPIDADENNTGMGEALTSIAGMGEAQFDVIVSNPPYVMEGERAAMHRNVLEHEPALALFVPDDDPLLFYRAIARWALALLAPGGLGIVEINKQLGRETASVFTEAGFIDVEVLCDLSGRDRFVRFRRA